MSGHSKWAKIKHQKASTDAKKSKVFSKYARLITVESKKCDGNVNSPSLRAVIEKAKGENMPNDNIERAVKKGKGGDSGSMEALTYEGYGPGGCAFIIESLTDNRNKAVQEIKFILSKHGGSLAEKGAASWAFTKTHEGWESTMPIPLNDADGEMVAKIIDELEDCDEVQEVYTNAE